LKQKFLYTSFQGKNLFSTASHLEFAFSNNSSSNFWSFRRFRLGKEMRYALEKSLSMGAEDSKVAFSLRKRSFTWEVMEAFQRVWSWLSKIAKDASIQVTMHEPILCQPCFCILAKLHASKRLVRATKISVTTTK